jgi:hypothetical protein
MLQMEAIQWIKLVLMAMTTEPVITLLALVMLVIILFKIEFVELLKLKL